MSSRAVVLLSGGLDSATVLALAKSRKFKCFALSFDYGQRHKHELFAARKVAKNIGAEKHVVLKLDLREFGGSALTDSIAVPKDRDVQQMSHGIPVTYVPARNTVFLSCALAWAETLSAFDIFIGVNALDYSGYPDCRPEYIAAYQQMANLATRAGVEKKGKFTIHAPLIDKKKSQIIQTGLALGVDYSLTLSCYDPMPDGRSCGHCDACTLRLAAFDSIGKKDPIQYVGK
ncbi:MAG TPA: 7-cyano-7-deazaguanine synthase QueC [Phycisphaerae bacterium]|nr:7-cyano-7-deazaguanine synthase QueC [Phycisphaerae bacterium]